VRLEHVAIWTTDLERLRAFYERYFEARAGERYGSVTRPGFTSYFLTFPDGDGRLELMAAPGLAATAGAAAVGSRADVEALTERMRGEGVPIVSGPRQTGDGYFESVVADPDGNEIEITADETAA
jgi:lactoylglutathione lyase